MAVDEPGEEPVTSQDARLTSLDERLRRAERVEDERRPPVDALAGVRSAGARAMQSLVGMPLGGALIGWLIDRWVGTAPWVMLGLMFAGFAGAVLDMMRISKQRSDTDAGK